MKYKKTKFMLIFIILLFLVIGVVSANEGNSTDIMQETNENEISIDDSLENNEYILKENVEADIIASDENISSSEINTYDSSKANLTLTTTTNFAKSGATYKIALTDLKGKVIPNKMLKIAYNGKTLEKTTNTNGEVAIKVGSSTSTMDVTFKGDSQYNGFLKSIKVYVENSITVTIGNAKLLSNGFLRIYLKGPAAAIAGKTVKIQVGNKVFTKKTTDEGFAVIKPQVSKGTYTVTLTYGNYTVCKKIKCIAGDVVNPFKKAIAMVNGVPDIDRMPANYVMGDDDAKYTVLKDQYKEVLKRDSYCLFLYGKLSKYTFFKTKSSPKIYHILKREKWNVIERTLNIKLVKKNKYSYWPSYVTASLKGKSYTYPVVRDVQNTEYTCGPTSASLCSQALKNYYSEKYFQKKAHVTSGVNLNVLKRAVDNSNFKSSYFYSMKTAVKQLAKGGCAVIAYLPNHYVSVIDVSKDGKKILVSNSYGKYDVGGDSKIPTGWVSLTKFNKKFRGVGLIVKPNYKISKTLKTKMNCFYKSMGIKYALKNTNERIPDVPI